MRIGLLGGLRIEHEGETVPVTGSMQLAVLFRLAVDAGTSVSYRAIAEDVWSTDAPENSRAALQSIVSRLRSQLPAGLIESTTGGYRLAVDRDDVDALRFSDLVARAVAANDPADASRALETWTGHPWTPSPNFDWFERDLLGDRDAAIRLVGHAPAPPARNALPTPLTALVGRDSELAAIAAQLSASRLVTVVGPGGAGKTRIALAAASAHRAAVLVELAPVGADELISAVLAATGRDIRTAEAAEPVGARARVLEALSGRDVLLVLDNCEHVIDAAAAMADFLLSALPSLRILATSREPLGVPGEAFVSLGSLAHPAEGELEALSPEQLGEFAAIELFRQRATAASGAALDPADLPGVARICARLDGLPLALELAAARLRTLTVDEVLAGLEDRFTLLTGGFRTGLPRHQTLRAMIDWSWSLLTPDEQRGLARLAVFPGGIDVADARRLASAFGLAGASVFDSLVDKSLLVRSRGRFRALETIREYGIERLAESGELEDARRGQARFVVTRASEFDRLLRGPRIYEAIAWFDSEDDNLAAALRFTTATGMADEAVQLCGACGWYWTIRDRQDDVQTWFAAAIPLAALVDSDEARLILTLAPVARAFTGSSPVGGATRDDDGIDMQRDAPKMLREMADAIGSPAGAGDNELLQVLPPLLSAFAAVSTDADWMLTVRLPHGEDLGLDPWPCALLHVVAAAVAQNRGDVPTLGIESEIAVALFSEIGDLWGLAFAQQMRSQWLTLNGRLDEALAMATASSEHVRPITSEWDLLQQQALSVTLLMRMARFDEARERASAFLAQADTSGNPRTILQSLMMTLPLEIHDRELDRGIAALARFDAIAADWPRLPGQLLAMAEVWRAELAMLAGDEDAAGRAMRAAADAALATRDHPVIGMVALGFGTLALARGDVREAVRAVDLATAIVGIYDATALPVVAIERAAALDGIERGGAVAPSRSDAIETLKQLTA